MVWSPENWEWSGWKPCRQDVFRDRYTANSFFHSGRNAAEERFWKKFVHRDGSYDAGGVQGRYVHSTWPAVRGVDYVIDEEVGEEKENMVESDNLQETDNEDSTEDKEHSTEDKEEREKETTLEEQTIERGRKRSECLQCSCSRSRSVSWGRVEQARVSKIERARAAGELVRAYQSKNAAFVSKLEKPRAAGELIRASSKMRVPVA